MYHEPSFEPVRDEMMEILKKHIPVLQRNELVSVENALGRVCAEDVTAPYNLPNTKVSSFDGIAVKFSSFADGMPDTSGWQEGREYVFSNTGMAIPEEYDTVIAIEDVTVKDDGGITVHLPPEHEGFYVNPPGSQMKQGEVLAGKGRVLDPVKLSLLVSAGYRSVNVCARPKVVFLPTGDELVPSGGAVPPGKNVESNSILVKALLEEAGADVVCGPVIPDEPQRLREVLKKSAEKADLVVVGAGSSKGRKDFTMDVLMDLGQVIVQEIGTAPGKHVSLTMIAGTPVLGIPGPPGGAQLACQYYGRAAVEMMCTGRITPVRRVRGVLTEDVGSRGIDFMQSVELFEEEDELRARPIEMMGGTRSAKRKIHQQILYCPAGRAFAKGETVWIEIPV